MTRRMFFIIPTLMSIIFCLSTSVQGQTTSQINVALASNGSTAVASSTANSSYLASGAINGDRRGQLWANGDGWNDGTSGVYPDWIQINFPGSRTINEIDIITLQDNFSSGASPSPTTTFSLYGITAFDVQYWDGSAWTNVPNGSVTGNNLVIRSFTFSNITTNKIRVVVNNALQNSSRIVEVEAYQSDVLPAVSLTSPANNSAFSPLSSVTLSATASDGDGTISKVEFFQGSTKLAVRYTTPYNFVWENVAAGSYTLTAKATDDLGATVTSSPVSINVSAPSGVISGKITRSDGTTPITPATVKVYQGITVAGTATTNSSGDYTVSGLDTASYTVEASAAGYESKTQTAVAVTSGATTTVNLSLAIPITYVYDELGRLTAAINTDGEAAKYSYDAVGNLLSISRPGPAQTSVIQFAPGSGTVGTEVIVYGTGFSATANQNTVTFNGVTASVISATATQIVTSVPSGASTGTISVTSPAGSATSSAAFTLVTGTGAPTITSFTPTVGTAGTAVTVSGTNFKTAISDNRVAFNQYGTSASSASSTSITTSVPLRATSGRVSLATPDGKVVSSADFFVPPAPKTATDVSYTGRMNFGDTHTANISANGKIALVVFDGTAGQKASLNITGVASTRSLLLTLYNPSGTTLISATNIDGGRFFDVPALPETGTYTILIVTGSPLGNNSGNVILTLYNMTAVAGSISPGGASVTVTTTIPGQNPTLTFYGTTGQRVSLFVNNSTFTNLFGLSILNPNGSTLTSTSFGGTNTFVEPVTLPTTGKYTIVVDPIVTQTGSATVTLYDVAPDLTASTTPGGSTVFVKIATPGQNASITFSGTAGQRISIKVTGTGVPGNNTNVKKPDGTNWFSIGMGSTGGFADGTTLPVTGTYTIIINPQFQLTGNMVVTIYDVADVTGTITPGGSSVAVNVAYPGQAALISFSGTAGQKVSLTVTDPISDSGNTVVRILKPDGNSLAAVTVDTGLGFKGFIDATSLPVTGTYKILVDPNVDYTVTMTIQLYDVPADVTGSVTIGGSAASVTISTPGQNGQITFSGTSGQQVTVRITNNNIGFTEIRLLKIDGTLLTSRFESFSNFNLSTQTLPATGTYTIVINPYINKTGSLNVAVTSP